jgi:hypothetical protein
VLPTVWTASVLVPASVVVPGFVVVELLDVAVVVPVVVVAFVEVVPVSATAPGVVGESWLDPIEPERVEPTSVLGVSPVPPPG